MSRVVVPALLSFAATAAAVGRPLSNGVNRTGYLHTVSDAAGLEAIDPRFTVRYEPGQDRLSATSCFMNAVRAMTELALEDFTGRIRPRNYIDLDYPGVVIVPRAAAQEQTVEVRYLLWGVWQGIGWMISQQSFRSLVIGAYWDDVLVCSIWIRRAWGQLSIAGSNGTLGLTARSERMSTRNTTVESTQGLGLMEVRTPSNDQLLKISVTHVGGPLGITEVFIAILAALEYLAHFPSADELIDFRIDPDGEDTAIGVGRHTQAPAVRSVLSYQWGILSVAEIPGYMLRERSFKEVIIEISLDNIPVGEGFLAKVRL